MISESRSKKMTKFIQINCLDAMEKFPIDTAKALIYMFEKAGFKFGSIDSQDFIDYFRERGSFSENDESKWLNDKMQFEFENVSYKNIKNKKLKLNMEILGTKFKLSNISVAFQSIDKIKTINLGRSIKDVFGELVNIFAGISDIISNKKTQGINSWDYDINDIIKDKYRLPDEKLFINKLEPLKKYFEKKNYDFKIRKDEKTYHITIRPLEIQNILNIYKGMYFSYQYLEYGKKISFIINRCNQIGLWLTSYGTNVDNGVWLELNSLSPEKVSSQHYGTDPITGDNRYKKRGKENLKYDSVKERQEKYIKNIIDWSQERSENTEVHQRYYTAIKKLYENGQK